MIPLWLMILCSAIMGLGTSIGGYRIIKSVGMDMVRLEKYQGFAADTAAALCLLVSSHTGVPVSNDPHQDERRSWASARRGGCPTSTGGVVREMVMTWVLTFPGCGLIGFLMAKLFFILF